MKTVFSLLLFVLPFFTMAQSLTATQLLERSIKYHDPGNNWQHFNDTLVVNMKIPNNPDRLSTINIDLPGDLFYVKAINDGNITEYTVNKGNCDVSFNGAKPDEATQREFGVNCERANVYKDYYTYLYGLPMKLKDPGAIIDPVVRYQNFEGKDYLQLKVTYDPAVGTDVWFFYFDPDTYAMEIYQFYKGDPDGAGKDTGEFILLTEESVISGIRFPKNRAWYYNKGAKYLGTDFLLN